MGGIGSLLAAVADPTRRALIDRLAQGPRRVTDLVAPFPMSLNAVSIHIKILESAGVMRRSRLDREQTPHLTAQLLTHIATWANRYTRSWTSCLDTLEASFTRRTTRHDLCPSPRDRPHPDPHHPRRRIGDL